MMDVNQSMPFRFEYAINEPAWREFWKNNWSHSIIYSILYVTVIFGGRRFMERRPAFQLRPVLAIWSGVLAVFSIIATVRTLPLLYDTLTRRGFEYTVCNNDYYENQTLVFWAVLFTLSKVYELGDTLFIVLRKQPLIFLHWYHHITVLAYCWRFYSEHSAPVWWFMVMNFVVHSLMYTYYTLRALRIRVPRTVSVCITMLQLAQMVMGLIVCITGTIVKSRGEACAQSSSSARYGILMYGSYFVLFANFFYSTYMSKPQAVLSFNKKLT